MRRGDADNCSRNDFYTTLQKFFRDQNALHLAGDPLEPLSGPVKTPRHHLQNHCSSNHLFLLLCLNVRLPPIFLSSQNAQRLGGSQVAQPLTTPVVSVATPSLLAPFSGMQTAYNTGKTAKAALPPCSRTGQLRLSLYIRPGNAKNLGKTKSAACHEKS